MIDLAQIHPVSEFVRNYKKLLDRVKTTGSPEVLTVNGKPEYVILDAATYRDIAGDIERRRFIKAVEEGIADMRTGRGIPADEAIVRIRTRLEI